MARIQGERVRMAREFRQWTQGQLAEKIGVKQPAIAQIEGDLVEPEESTLQAVAFATRFPVGFFSRPIECEFPLGSLLYRARASLAARDKTAVRRYAQIAFELYRELSREKKLPELRLPRLDQTGSPESAARITRAQLGLSPDTPIQSLINCLERNGVCVLGLPVDLSGHDAFSLWVEDRPVVVLLLKGKTGDRIRFSTSHELGHLVMHRAFSGSVPDVEKEANRFAGAFLLPETLIWEEMVPPITLRSLMPLKKRWGLSMQALVERAEDLEIITPRQRRYLHQQIRIRLGIDEGGPVAITEKPRALRQMWEMDFPGTLDPKEIIDRIPLPAQIVRELLDAQAERASNQGKIVNLASVRRSQ